MIIFSSMFDYMNFLFKRNSSATVRSDNQGLLHNIMDYFLHFSNYFILMNVIFLIHNVSSTLLLTLTTK